MYILKKVMEVLKGKVFSLLHVFDNTISVPSRLRLGKHVEICARSNGKIEIKNNVVINSNSIISSLNGGNMTLQDGVSLGNNNVVVCHECIIIGKDTITGPNVFIYDHDHVFDYKNGVKKREYTTEAVYIGKNCWIGANTVILKGTMIGDRCVIGAGSVIKGKYADGTVIIQKRDEYTINNG